MCSGSLGPWSVYMIAASDGSLYTGITLDIERRFQEHAGGKTGAKYFNRGRRPVAVVYRENGLSRSAAGQRESGIKKMTRAQKLALVAGCDTGKDPGKKDANGKVK